MSFLERMIRRGISQGIENAVGQAVQKVVEPKATELANQAADRLEQASQNYAQQSQSQQTQTFSGLEGALENLKRSVEGYVTEAAQNMKVCPNCETPCGADKKFCPSCGTKLPEETVAQSAVCPNCGKQNSLGTKFCSDCGTKLPVAVQEEEAAKAKEAEIMAQWDTQLSAYPKWNGGGKDFDIENYGNVIVFGASFPNNFMAQEALKKYRILLQENGFCMAGQYPNINNLYKKIGSICYHMSTDNCFSGDNDRITIEFQVGEPSGGFDYVKPEEAATKAFKNFFDF